MATKNNKGGHSASSLVILAKMKVPNPLKRKSPEAPLEQRPAVKGLFYHFTVKDVRTTGGYIPPCYR